MNSVLLWIGGLLVAVLGLLFAVPYVVDWNAYRGVFEEEATRVLGRDVRVGGKVALQLLPAPYVRFEKIRISDSTAALGEPFFRAEAFTLWLSAAPLLRGAIEAKEIELDQPVLRLAVDEQGRGNWQQIKITPGALPFLPSDVVLEHVRIRNGSVSLKTAGSSEPLTLTGIDGEVAATSLDGPYRFRGAIKWRGQTRELRVSTSQREADGRIRFKASVRAAESGNSYVMDGAVTDLNSGARYSGALTALIPFGGMARDGQEAVRSGTARPNASVAELRSTIEGDLETVRLPDLSLAFEVDGKPQMLTGNALSTWRGGLRQEIKLASRWLDLDRIAGADNTHLPLDIARTLVRQATGLLADEGTSLISIGVDQVNLGGEAVSDVRMAMARAGGLTSLGELTARLPGNTKAELRGTIGGGAARAPVTGATVGAAPVAAATPALLDGEIVLRGTSYRRLAAWLRRASAADTAPGAADRQQDGPVSFVSRLRLAPDRLDLTQSRLELGRIPLLFDAGWQWSGQRQLKLDVEGPSINLAALATLVPYLGEARVTAPSTAPDTTPDTPPSEQAAPDLRRLDLKGLGRRVEEVFGSLQLSVRAPLLSSGPTILRNVDARLSYQRDRLQIASFTASTPIGARLDLQGELKSPLDKPSGTLDGWLAADGVQATAELAALLGDVGFDVVRGWLQRTTRSNLGFTVRFDADPSSKVAFSARGLADGRDVAVSATVGGVLADWRTRPLDLSIAMSGSDLAAELGRLLRPGDRPGAPLAALADVPAGNRPAGDHLLVRAAGTSPETLVTLAEVQIGSARALFEGKTGLTSDGGLQASGDVDLGGMTTRDLAAFIGAADRGTNPAEVATGRVAMTLNDGTLGLSTRRLAVAGSDLAGALSVARAAGATKVAGRLVASSLSLPGLLGLVSSAPARPQTIPSPDDAKSDQSGAWSDLSFASDAVGSLTGTVGVTTPRLVLAEGMVIADAAMTVGFEPNRITVKDLAGAGLGGRLTADAALELGARSAATLTLSARLAGGKMEALLGPDWLRDRPRDRVGPLGEAEVTLRLTGQGGSPRTVVGNLAGTGEIELSNARVAGIWPGAIDKVAASLIDGTGEIKRELIETALRREMASADVVVGGRKLRLDVGDGVISVLPLVVETSDGRGRNMTTIDLSTLKADSEWQLVPAKPTGGRREPLPGVTLVWSGPIVDIARHEPRVTLDVLEREIAIRRIERETERLEEARRQDEPRGLIETDRGQEPNRVETPQIWRPPVIRAPFPLPPAAQPAPAQAAPASATPPGASSAGPPSPTPPPAGPAPVPRPRVQSLPGAKTLGEQLLGAQ